MFDTVTPVRKSLRPGISTLTEGQPDLLNVADGVDSLASGTHAIRKAEPVGGSDYNAYQHRDMDDCHCFHIVRHTRYVAPNAPNLNDATHEARGPQPRRDGRICCAWLATSSWQSALCLSQEKLLLDLMMFKTMQ